MTKTVSYSNTTPAQSAFEASSRESLYGLQKLADEEKLQLYDLSRGQGASIRELEEHEKDLSDLPYDMSKRARPEPWAFEARMEARKQYMAQFDYDFEHVGDKPGEVR
jgi:hypothetical protein